MLDALSTAAPLAEDGRPLSRAEWARALGICQGHLSRLLAAERRRGAAELPYVALVEAPGRGLHYRLDADELSRLPECPFRIGTSRGRSLQVAHRDDSKGDPPRKTACPHKFRPKRPKRG